MSENPLQQFTDENPDWIQRWLLCQKEFDNGNPLPLAMLQMENEIEVQKEKEDDTKKT